MNKTILVGRVVRDPTVRFTAGEKKVVTYTLAVPRPVTGKDGVTTDFPRCVCIFPKAADFAQQHLYKGLKVIVTGRVQTGSYEKDGMKHYTTDILVENQEFAESKKNAPARSGLATDENGYLQIPDGIEDELPFK